MSRSHGPRLLVANCLGQNNCLGSGKSQALFSSASVRETTHNEWEESAETRDVKQMMKIREE